MRWARLSGSLSTSLRRETLDAPAPGIAEILGEWGEVSGQQFALRDHHEIHRNGFSGRRREMAEEFSDQSFGSVALDRSAQLPGGYDAESRPGQSAREHQKREKPAVDAGPAVEYRSKFAAPPDAAFLRELGREPARASRAIPGIAGGPPGVRTASFGSAQADRPFDSRIALRSVDRHPPCRLRVARS